MGNVFTHDNLDYESRYYKDMSGEELISAYGMNNTECDKDRLSDFLEAIHRDEIDQMMEIALFGGTMICRQTERIKKQKFE